MKYSGLLLGCELKIVNSILKVLDLQVTACGWRRSIRKDSFGDKGISKLIEITDQVDL
ncbi:MAG: hypothetical protein IPO32_17205 [Crocinitomicaceae bacterium]|nr:hypothetical protein [Crocinitomicaceae bacterium]